MPINVNVMIVEMVESSLLGIFIPCEMVDFLMSLRNNKSLYASARIFEFASDFCFFYPKL